MLAVDQKQPVEFDKGCCAYFEFFLLPSANLLLAQHFPLDLTTANTTQLNLNNQSILIDRPDPETTLLLLHRKTDYPAKVAAVDDLKALLGAGAEYVELVGVAVQQCRGEQVDAVQVQGAREHVVGDLVIINCYYRPATGSTRIYCM